MNESLKRLLLAWELVLTLNHLLSPWQAEAAACLVGRPLCTDTRSQLRRLFFQSENPPPNSFKRE